MHWMTILGIIIIAIGTCLTFLGQQIVTKRSEELLQAKSDKIFQLSQENVNLSKELSKLNQEIAATVTGGDSFCYLFPTVAYGEINTINFNLDGFGEYPVYDVFVRIWDSTCLNMIDHGKIFEKHYGFRNKQFETIEQMREFQSEKKHLEAGIRVNNDIKKAMSSCVVFEKGLGTVSATARKSNNIVDMPIISFTYPKESGDKNIIQEYDVNFTARNGAYSQQIKIGLKNKRYYVYSRVLKVSENEEPFVMREYESVDSEGFAIKMIK